MPTRSYANPVPRAMQADWLYSELHHLNLIPSTKLGLLPCYLKEVENVPLSSAIAWQQLRTYVGYRAGPLASLFKCK